MRQNRAESSYGRSGANGGVVNGITTWQIPAGQTLQVLIRDSYWRGGTAPSTSNGSRKSYKNYQSPVNITQISKEAQRRNLLLNVRPRGNAPVRANHHYHYEKFQQNQNPDSMEQSNDFPSPNNFLQDIEDNAFKLGQIEDDSAEEFQAWDDVPIQRPPCRQGETVFDLDDRISTVAYTQKLDGFMQNVKEKSERLPINFLQDTRPPSRHKTPPKALGLDSPSQSAKFDTIDFQNSSSSTSSLELASNTGKFSISTPSKSKPRPSTQKKPSIKRGQKKKSTGGTRMHSVSRNEKKAWAPEPEVKEHKRFASNGRDARSVRDSYPRLEPGKNQNQVNTAWPQKRNMYNVPIIISKRDGQLKYSTTHGDGGVALMRNRNQDKNNRQAARKNELKARIEANKIPFESSLEPEFLGLFAKR